MTQSNHQAAGNGGAFGFDCGDNWLRLSADLSQLCQNVGQQLRRTVAQIDIEGIRDELRRAVDDIAAEARDAADNFRNSAEWSGPTRVRVDIRADSPAQPGQPADLAAERKTVLELLAQGKINIEEATRLLDALGN